MPDDAEFDDEVDEAEDVEDFEDELELEDDGDGEDDAEFDDDDFEDDDFDDENFPDAGVEVPYDDPLPRRRAPGFITAGLLGVQEALYGVKKNEIVMVADAGGMPEPDFEINLTPDPRDATVILRKHGRR